MNPRRTSIWIAPWDADGRDPGALLDQLEDCGLQAASLALSYHGGRLLLGNHPRRVVYEQHQSALYFHADTSRFGEPRPEIAPEARAAHALLEAAARRGFPVEAWTVLCHNDLLGTRDPSLCVQNAFGETYSYALCPANPRVSDYCAELCRQVAQVEGLAGLDLEALSFLGYEHASLHDKRGGEASGILSEMLSICLCPHCRAAMGPGAAALERHARRNARAILAGEEPRGLPAELEMVLIMHRAGAQRRLLGRVREAVGKTRLNLRLAPNERFTGGKCSLPEEAVAGVVEEATVTYFGVPLETIRLQAGRLKPRGVRMRAGFVFHGPDCHSAADLVDRIEALSTPVIGGLSFYSYSLAQPRHLDWLRSAIHRGVKP